MREDFSVKQRLFCAVAGMAPKLPNFQVRTRLFLKLFRLLGLASKHTKVVVTLQEPVCYLAALDLRSWLQRIAFLTGSYEADTSARLIDLYECDGRKGFFLDIGANVGLISLPFAMHFRPQKVRCFAVEMVPDNFRALVENIKLNGLEDIVTPIHAGLGDVAREVKFRIEGNLVTGEGTGNANIVPDDPNQLTAYKFVSARGNSIQIDTLDSLAKNGRFPGECSLIKIDADGYDLKILQGAKSFIDMNRPLIFGEFSSYCMGWHGQQRTDMYAFANSIDYDVFDPSGRSLTDASDLEESLLLVPRERGRASVIRGALQGGLGGTAHKRGCAQ